jgi:hypothetical protein
VEDDISIRVQEASGRGACVAVVDELKEKLWVAVVDDTEEWR